ncbi:MAG: methylmalonyl Co-A mutase-associated GTPase MeaB, partial [Desulfuromonadales bacterium]
IADIFVVNKADRPEADRAARELEMLVEMNHPGEGQWWPPVVRTVARKNEGVEDLVSRIEEHRTHMNRSDKRAHFEENKSAIQFTELLKEKLFLEVYSYISAGGRLAKTIRAIARRELDPYSAVEEVLKERLK